MSTMAKVYMSKEANDSGLMPIDEFTITFIPDVSINSLNYHTQSYEYLKSLPQFENAIDISE